MDKKLDKMSERDFLHNHPKHEKTIRDAGYMDEFHVIIDRPDWEEAKKLLPRYAIMNTQIEEFTDEDKRIIIKEFTEVTVKHALILFYMLGLKTHIDAMVVNQSNGDEFVLSFKKVVK